VYSAAGKSNLHYIQNMNTGNIIWNANFAQATDRQIFVFLLYALKTLGRGVIIFLLLFSTFAMAQTGAVLPQARVGIALSGSVFTYTVRQRDSLTSIGARFGMEPRLLASTNAISMSDHLKPEQQLEVDNRHIVPAGLDDAIIINLPQRMLFRLVQGHLQAAYPIAAGKPNWSTPIGPFDIERRVRDKTWIVPLSIQKEMRLKGKRVLKRVPPGVNNPLGKYWMGLSIPGIGIHSTTAPQSIYHFQSHGCIRLHPDDASDLFNAVEEGDAGSIIYQPLLLLRLPDGRVFVEVHRDIYKKGIDVYEVAKELANAEGAFELIDWEKVLSVVAAHDGIAREVSRAIKQEPPP
jgi:L,D-transpeptidase ErfK/SrfK